MRGGSPGNTAHILKGTIMTTTNQPVFNVVLVATDPDSPDNIPMSEAHWELTAEEVQSVSAAFIAKMLSETGRGTMVFHMRLIAD